MTALPRRNAKVRDSAARPLLFLKDHLFCDFAQLMGSVLSSGANGDEKMDFVKEAIQGESGRQSLRLYSCHILCKHVWLGQS